MNTLLSSNSFSLQSVSVSELPDQINNNNNNSEKMFTVTNSRERRLLGGLLVSLLGQFVIRSVLLYMTHFLMAASLRIAS